MTAACRCGGDAVSPPGDEGVLDRGRGGVVLFLPNNANGNGTLTSRASKPADNGIDERNGKET